MNFLVWAIHNYFERRNLDTAYLDTFSYAINLVFYFTLGIAIFLNCRKPKDMHGNF